MSPRSLALSAPLSALVVLARAAERYGRAGGARRADRRALRQGPSGSAPNPRRAALLSFLLALAACTGETPPLVEPGSDPAEARRQLAAAAAAGPVPVVVLRLEERPSEAEAAALAASGVRGIAVRFAPSPPTPAGRRLVLALDGLEEPERICAGAERPEPSPVGRALLAAWCDGERPVARVRLATAADRVARERAIWRAMARLFPDDYAESYGWNLFGLRITVGGSFGF